MHGFGEKLAHGDRQTERQRWVPIYTSESARWASDQKLRNANERIVKKMQKNLHFWAFWAKKAHFGQFLAKMGKTALKKKAWNIFVTHTSPN